MTKETRPQNVTELRHIHHNYRENDSELMPLLWIAVSCLNAKKNIKSNFSGSSLIENQYIYFFTMEREIICTLTLPRTIQKLRLLNGMFIIYFTSIRWCFIQSLKQSNFEWKWITWFILSVSTNICRTLSLIYEIWSFLLHIYNCTVVGY